MISPILKIALLDKQYFELKNFLASFHVQFDRNQLGYLNDIFQYSNGFTGGFPEYFCLGHSILFAKDIMQVKFYLLPLNLPIYIQHGLFVPWVYSEVQKMRI